MFKGLLKVGFTAVDVAQRVAQQYPTKRPDGKIPYQIVFAESAMTGVGYDNSELPSFTAAVAYDDGDEDDDEPVAVKIEAKRPQNSDPLAVRKVIIPPAPKAPPVGQKPPFSTPKATGTVSAKPAIDTSGVRVGSKLSHKAFGAGIVKALDEPYISVDFGGEVKKFIFPAAILQGFLKIE